MKEIKIPIWQPESHHLPLLQCPKRFKVIIFHRKARKTTWAINELIRWAAARQGVYWYLGPFRTQVERIVWDDPTMLPRYIPPGWKTNATDLTLKAPNGSIIYFLGAENAEALRGPNPYGVIFDEFDDIAINVWEAIVHPVLTMNGGWASFVGTPKGEGNLFQFWDKYSDNEDKNWECFMLKASQSGLFSQTELDENREESPEDVYNQEMECAFISGGTNVFKRVDENVYFEEPVIFDNRQYKLGVDLAKLNDWTVIAPLDLHTWKIGRLERFNMISYPLIEAKIEAEYLRYNQAQIDIDSTGIGEAVCDHLEEKKLPLNRFIFTENSRAQLLENLAIKIEQDKIKIPNYPQLIKELKACRREYVGRAEKRGRLKITSLISDDCVMAAALAVKDLYAPLPVPGERTRKDKKIKKRSGINPFY